MKPVLPAALGEKAGRASGWQRLLGRLHVDAHILATLLFRSWSVIAGGVTVLLIPLCLTSIQQGYYFTFASILALQVFFELGMGQVILQLVAHEAAYLAPAEHGGYDGPRHHLDRLLGLRRLLRRWYFVASVLFLLCVNVLGALFFRGGELGWNVWLGPWAALVVATAGNLFLSWKIAMVEGFGHVCEVNRLRLRQSMVGFGLMWVALVMGGGLWVAALVPAAALVFSSVWLTRHGKRHDLGEPVGEPSAATQINWRTEILPFQWRIAVSWISGFFIFQLFAPLIFKYHGAVEAGRVGLGITVFNSVTAVSTSWVAAKVPAIGGLLAKGQRTDASALYKRLATASFLFACVGALMLLAVDYLIHRANIPFATRVPDLPLLAWLAFAAIGNAFILPAALFMRAHKEEPLLASAVAMAIATSLAVYVAAPHGAVWVVASYGALVWIIGVPWTGAILLRRYYRSSPSQVVPR